MLNDDDMKKVKETAAMIRKRVIDMAIAAGEVVRVDEFLSLEEAARVLRISPPALRKRCTRAARTVGGETVAKLGAGVRGVKVGNRWRIRLARAS